MRKKVIIIGSGVAGVGASLQFVRKGIKPCILDIGYENKLDNTPIEENIYDFCENRNSFEFLIGESQSGLRSIDRRNTYLPAKLTAPRLNYITHNVSKLSPIQEEKYNAVQSFSKGGLANGWGAGLYRFDDNDLQHFPIDAHELDKYYNDLTEEIGISGTIDDLSPFFGNGENLQKELNISKNANILYKKYRKKSDKLNKQGIFIGRPRLGVLSDTKHERQKCDYNNLEFWQHDLDYIYSPKYTLNRLIKKNEVDYINNTLVKYYQERDGEITVYTKNSENNKEVVYKCDKLIIAAGGIGSAKIVLQSNQDYTTKLKLLDNPSIQIPLVFPKQIGTKLEKNTFGLTQLNLIYNQKNKKRLQASILEVTSPARAEFYKSFPLAAKDNLKLIKYILPGMMVMQVFYPCEAKDGADLSLNDDGSLKIVGKDIDFDSHQIKKILQIMRSLGAYSHSSIVQKIQKGLGIHYAGSLPMRMHPVGKYECDRAGKLNNSSGIYIVDGACFPDLPAKNYSFSIMANAMRIVDGINI